MTKRGRARIQKGRAAMNRMARTKISRTIEVDRLREANRSRHLRLYHPGAGGEQPRWEAVPSMIPGLTCDRCSWCGRTI